MYKDCLQSHNTMRNSHQSIKQVLIQGLRRLHNASIDINVFSQLQQRILKLQHSFQQGKTKLLQLSADHGLQITKEAQSKFSAPKLQNFTQRVKQYLKAGGQLIEGLVILTSQPGKNAIPTKKGSESQALKNVERAQDILKKSLISDSNEQSDQLQIDLEDIQMLSEDSLKQDQSNNLKRQTLPKRINRPSRVYVNKEEQSESNLSTQNERTKHKKTVMPGKLVTQLYADLKKPSLNKKQIQKKYNISQSTVNRYIRRLKDKQQLPQYLQKRVLKGRQKTHFEHQRHIQPPSRQQQHAHQQKQLNRRKNSKMRLIEPKLIQIYSKYPQIYQSQAASMLSRFYKQQISIHVVSRCLKTIAKRKKLGKQEQDKRTTPVYQNTQQNSSGSIDNRYYFASQFISRSQNSIIYVDQGTYKNNSSVNNIQKIHFALALSGVGKIVHWKLKSQSFRAEEIASFIDELSAKFQGYTIILDNAQIHRLDPIKNLLKDKCINHLYLPPYSSLMNPIELIFPYCNREFKRKLNNQSVSLQLLRVAHFTIMQIKDKVFIKEITSARHFVDVAFRKEPFPVKTKLNSE